MLALFEYAIYLEVAGANQCYVEEWIPMRETNNDPNEARGGESFVITPEEREFMVVLAQCFARELKAAVQGAQEGLVKDDAIAAFLCGYRLGHVDGMRVARKRAE